MCIRDSYVGYAVTQSVWGAVGTTIAVCLPSFILVLLISYFFVKCKDNIYIKAAMSGLLPMSVSLIAAAASVSYTHLASYLRQLLRNDLQYAPFRMEGMEPDVREMMEIDTCLLYTSCSSTNIWQLKRTALCGRLPTSASANCSGNSLH